MLVAARDRRIERLGERGGLRDSACEHDAGAGEDDGEFGLGEQTRSFRDRFGAAGGTLERHDLRKFDVDDLRPEIAGHVDLRGRGGALRLRDHAVQHFGDARGIAHLFLVADHVGEQRHLRHFLEAALANRLVGGLRRDEQQRRVVPIGGFYRGDEAGDAGTVLRDRHRHFAGRPRIAIGHHASVGFVGAVPESNAGFRKQIGNRHHRRADDAKRLIDAVHLQDLDEGLFGRHAQWVNSRDLRPLSGQSQLLPESRGAGEWE